LIDANNLLTDGVVIGLSVGLGVPLFILLVVTCLLLCCLFNTRCRRGSNNIQPVEAINTFFPWPSKSIGSSRTGTARSTTFEYCEQNDGESVCDTPTSSEHSGDQSRSSTDNLSV